MNESMDNAKEWAEDNDSQRMRILEKVSTIGIGASIITAGSKEYPEHGLIIDIRNNEFYRAIHDPVELIRTIIKQATLTVDDCDLFTAIAVKGWVYTGSQAWEGSGKSKWPGGPIPSALPASSEFHTDRVNPREGNKPGSGEWRVNAYPSIRENSFHIMHAKHLLRNGLRLLQSVDTSKFPYLLRYIRWNLMERQKIRELITNLWGTIDPRWAPRDIKEAAAKAVGMLYAPDNNNDDPSEEEQRAILEDVTKTIESSMQNIGQNKGSVFVINDILECLREYDLAIDKLEGLEISFPAGDTVVFWHNWLPTCHRNSGKESMPRNGNGNTFHAFYLTKAEIFE